MSNWKVQVTLHNIVNIPSAACTGGEKAFVVELHLQNALAHSLRAPTASVMFTSSEVTENTPGLFEKRLDGEGQSDANPQVWTCTAPLLEITATVKELLVPPTSRRITESDLRVVGTSAPFSVSVKEITEETKLKTIVLGCEMGQIGVSLSVDPSDKDGYRRRLRDFLTRHNPKGLRLLESVVESVPELDTFTKLFRKYKIKNYEERLANFFKVYGPEHVGQIQPLLQQWEGREEELMRNMILDNGPELCDVDPRARLDAFLGAHQLARSDPRVKAILERYPSGKDSSRWERLVSQFGPEPDPRTYAFTPVYYEAATRKTASSPTPRSSTRNDPTRVEEEAPTPSDGYSPNPVKPAARGPLEDKLLSLAFTPKIDFGSGDKKEAPPKPWARPPSSRQEEASAYPSKPLASVFDENKFGPSFSREVVPVTRDVEDTIRSPDGLWRKMCKVLQSKRGVEPWQLFYGNKEYFIDLLDSLDLFVKDERKTLIGEWQRRALEAVAEEPLHTGSSYFYSASHEAALILRVKPISLQVLGITNVRNKEHILGFNAITAEQGASACVERLALVGEEAALRKVVQEGAGSMVRWSVGRPPLRYRLPQGTLSPLERGPHHLRPAV
ncbi:hypothetical protein ADEAN_000761600 [Angomonas deanei]|uniref:Uncharacterized protein n=1 Tax=Angomonas deanei TaxID=59799 RepID=A0A7G2CMG3_9TRYP|nr:hypothetical protein ADEAN_000761600 [Angomonas deanei]